MYNLVVSETRDRQGMKEATDVNIKKNLDPDPANQRTNELTSGTKNVTLLAEVIMIIVLTIVMTDGKK